MKNFMIHRREKQKKPITFLYIVGLLGMLSILMSIFISREEPGDKVKGRTYKDITSSWTLDREGTQAVDVKKLGEYMDEESGVLSMYYQLPEMNSDVSLVYRSKDVYTCVLVDEEVIYETSVYESEFYNRSPGNLWNVLNVNSKYSGKCLELQITMVYDTNAITVDSLLFGDKANIILGIFGENMFGIIVSLVMVVLGVVLLVMDWLPSYVHVKKHHGLCWIGIYAFLTGIWSLIETNVVQFCVVDMRILQLIDNMIMMIDTVPLLLYLDKEYQILKNKGMRALGYIGVGYVLICVFVQFMVETMDMHHMLNNGLYIMIITDFAMCIWLIVRFFKLKKAQEPAMNCFLMIVGLVSCCSCSIFETFRSMQVDRMDRAGLLRIGMLLLCICFAIGSQIETYKIVEHGLKYDLISKLAYSDGLTGLGNRTAYLEQLEEYEEKAKEIMQLGIVYLDVNNLKPVNDGLGHEWGDELIRTAAKIVEGSFGHFGRSYRIGGDEFCVLLTGDSVEAEYEKGLEVFKHLVEETNRADLFEFDVQIAQGFAICKEITKEKIEETIADADSQMYQNKTEMKRRIKNPIIQGKVAN